jgi:hypothetical protein
MTISVTVVDWLKVSLNTVRGYSINSKLELVLWHRPQRRSGLLISVILQGNCNMIR